MNIETQVGSRLMALKKKLVTAESCTGGLISHMITNNAGSSAYFLGGVVSYSNEAKEKMLGVKHSTLMKYGAVSAETALEMAYGVRCLMKEYFNIDQIVGLSVTGIAGPGGGTPEKPVGVVWVGLSTDWGEFSKKYNWKADRLENKSLSAEAALKLLLEKIDGPFDDVD